MKCLNYSFTGVNSVFKYFKSLDFGLLQQSQNTKKAVEQVDLLLLLEWLIQK